MKVLITGSCGLIGSEGVEYYAGNGNEVVGIDNDMRAYFFGPEGSTLTVREDLVSRFRNYRHEEIDIRNREGVNRIFKDFKPDLIIHAASQPSHDWAAKEPHTDFEVNALATLNLLDAARTHCPKSVFVFLSTNKVYGDLPNHLKLKETPMRWEYATAHKGKGISEEMSIDQCLHSLFGASKVAADVLTQEYGRYFGMNTVAFRGGCLTGSRHRGVRLHGFLSYLVNSAVKGETYTIFGYQGKQVRDQIHSLDVIQAIECFRKKPRPGEVYNLGGGFKNSASILELVELFKKEFGLKLKTKYDEQARRGDHICYYTDMTKFQKHYPDFTISKDLNTILTEMIGAVEQAQKAS